jgi:NADPH:quinone reductase-like Zn-dependent oxidoreductase
MSTHQAVITPAKGQPIAAAAVPTAQLGLGTEEVLVTVQYAGLNPIDLAQMQDGKFITSYPYVLGKEWSGTVAATGSGVKDLKEGDSVRQKRIVCSLATF